jgi:hypothetical protein
MVSEAQMAANRLNAQKSTGPRTARGKVALARNALKHGLTAKTVVLFDESKTAFERFHQAQALDFEPRTAGECALVEQIATLGWRLRRASRAEATLVNAEAERRRERLAADPEAPLRADISLMFSWLDKDMSALTRYETAIARQLDRAIATLERFQARRRERAAADAQQHPADTKETQFAEGNQ